ncbi:protein kinase [Actinoallomurus spadix]|uniref:Protein kinase domain-containing protein n=1 Tax=Actinoallomurus spadix TaxID=79912 RepID=A0ABN0X738_9ACTN|nr:protein kinase [Actinoallomurus spadix]MCO5987012.1 protein kinase [Actinoallomurus spadix]
MTDTERPGETRRDEFTTRRDTSVSAEGGIDHTRRDGREAGSSLVRLPADLADRFAVVGEIPAQGAESDLLHVRDLEGTDLVVKIFRRGFTADRSVWRKLPTLGSAHVVRIPETGHAEGRDYEVIEYVAEGNLRALSAPLSPAVVTEVVAQLADGLTRLHEAGIVHRDLKPENVLVRSTAPLDLAIADFGLSRVIEQSVVFASSSRTLAYAAPESLSGQVSPARDWWSLGIMVRELLTGRMPFAGMSETVVVDHLATRTIGCDDVIDPRMRLLCRGLLTRDPRRRWGGDEVARWLAGESPAVAEETSGGVHLPTARGPHGALAFSGEVFTDRRELARALVADWDTAARYFFGTMFTPVGPSEAWQALRDWLSGFDDAEGRIRLVDERLTGNDPPDVKVFWLVRWLDPTLGPVFLGLRLVSEDLAVLAALVDDPEHAEHGIAARTVRRLWEHRLLPLLDGLPEGTDLSAIDARWRGLVTGWNRYAQWLRGQLPSTVSRLPDAGFPGRDEPPKVLATMLALAARPEETRRSLSTAADRARASVHVPVSWFSWLSEQAGDDPLRLLAVVLAAPDAVLEAEAEVRRRREAEHRSAERRRRWEERERRRLDGRRAAIRRAALWTLPLAVLWFSGSWLAPQILQSAAVRSMAGTTGNSSDPTPLLLTAAGATWIVELGCEVLLAARQGAEYLPLGPWSWLAKVLRVVRRGLSGASSRMSGTARRSGPRGCGTALLVAVVPLFIIFLLIATLLSIAWLLWMTILIAVAIAHVVVTGIRMQRWQQEHRGAREKAVGGRE